MYWRNDAYFACDAFKFPTLKETRKLMKCFILPEINPTWKAKIEYYHE
jgi:hypothetical protein